MQQLIPALLNTIRASDDLGFTTVERYADHLDPKKLTRLTNQLPAVYIIGGEWTRGGDGRAAVYALVVTQSPALERTEAAASGAERADELAQFLTRPIEYAGFEVDVDKGVTSQTAMAGDRFAVTKMAIPMRPI